MIQNLGGFLRLLGWNSAFRVACHRSNTGFHAPDAFLHPNQLSTAQETALQPRAFGLPSPSHLIPFCPPNSIRTPPDDSELTRSPAPSTQLGLHWNVLFLLCAWRVWTHGNNVPPQTYPAFAHDLVQRGLYRSEVLFVTGMGDWILL